MQVYSKELYFLEEERLMVGYKTKNWDKECDSGNE